MWDSFGDGVQTHAHTHTQVEMPDGYVKMLFKMMLQFFIPTEFIQDPVSFFQDWKEKKKRFIIVVYHSICFCDTILVLFTLVGWWAIPTKTIRIHCFLVFLSIQFYFMNMNSSTGKWKINQFIDEELIAVFQGFGLAFSNIKKAM